MKNKSFSNKLDELKSIVPVHHEIEKKLLPRLKFMGYVMYALCIASFSYAIAVREETESTPPKEGLIDPEFTEAVSFEMLMDEGELDLSPTEVLNFYLVALIFAAVGATCFIIAWKKRKNLSKDTPVSTPNPEK